MDAETRRVLSTAKGLIARGHCKGHARDANGFCVVGAVANAGRKVYRLGPLDLATPFVQPALAQLRQFQPALVLWNDAPETTQADVVALFDRALSEPEPLAVVGDECACASCA